VEVKDLQMLPLIDQKLPGLEDTWSSQFFDYFRKYKACTFKESMITPVREKAGLGHPPKEYHNNSLECNNNVIK